MSLYNPLLRVAQMAKTGEAAAALKSSKDVLGNVGKAGQSAISAAHDSYSARRGIAEFAKWAAIPAGVGIGGGIGALALGKGVEAGFGVQKLQQDMGKVTGVLLFLGFAVVAVLLAVYALKAYKK